MPTNRERNKVVCGGEDSRESGARRPKKQFFKLGKMTKISARDTGTGGGSKLC